MASIRRTRFCTLCPVSEPLAYLTDVLQRIVSGCSKNHELSERDVVLVGAAGGVGLAIGISDAHAPHPKCPPFRKNVLGPPGANRWFIKRCPSH
jgi:hypothetical protein